MSNIFSGSFEVSSSDGGPVNDTGWKGEPRGCINSKPTSLIRLTPGGSFISSGDINEFSFDQFDDVPVVKDSKLIDYKTATNLNITSDAPGVETLNSCPVSDFLINDLPDTYSRNSVLTKSESYSSPVSYQKFGHSPSPASAVTASNFGVPGFIPQIAPASASALRAAGFDTPDCLLSQQTDFSLHGKRPCLLLPEKLGLAASSSYNPHLTTVSPNVDFSPVTVDSCHINNPSSVQYQAIPGYAASSQCFTHTSNPVLGKLLDASSKGNLNKVEFSSMRQRFLSAPGGTIARVNPQELHISHDVVFGDNSNITSNMPVEDISRSPSCSKSALATCPNSPWNLSPTVSSINQWNLLANLQQLQSDPVQLEEIQTGGSILSQQPLECGSVNSLALPNANLYCNEHQNSNMYFWQYNTQSKQRSHKNTQSIIDPYSVHEDFRDPIFETGDNDYSHKPVDQQSLRHPGKARRGDGTDSTPNPTMLLYIGNLLTQLNNEINGIPALNEQSDSQDLEPNQMKKVKSTSRGTDSASLSSITRREKNMLASRVCRLKRKAQHEANKIIMSGLKAESERVLHSIAAIESSLRARLFAPPSNSPSLSTLSSISPVNNAPPSSNSFTEECQQQFMLSNNATRCAGRTSDFVLEVLERVQGGDATGGLLPPVATTSDFGGDDDGSDNDAIIDAVFKGRNGKQHRQAYARKRHYSSHPRLIGDPNSSFLDCTGVTSAYGH